MKKFTTKEKSLIGKKALEMVTSMKILRDANKKLYALEEKYGTAKFGKMICKLMDKDDNLHNMNEEYQELYQELWMTINQFDD